MRQVLEELLREKHQRRVVNLEKDDWVFRRKNGRRIVSFRGAFDIAARKAGIAERDAEYREPFTPHCFRRPAISRWAKVGLPEAIVRRCFSHADRDVPRTTSRSRIVSWSTRSTKRVCFRPLHRCNITPRSARKRPPSRMLVDILF